MRDTIVVVQVGCLECSHPSYLLGIYATVAEAQAKHPEAELRSAMSDHRGGGSWWGSDKTVIFDVPGNPEEA